MTERAIPLIWRAVPGPDQCTVEVIHASTVSLWEVLRDLQQYGLIQAGYSKSAGPIESVTVVTFQKAHETSTALENLLASSQEPPTARAASEPQNQSAVGNQYNRGRTSKRPLPIQPCRWDIWRRDQSRLTKTIGKSEDRDYNRLFCMLPQAVPQERRDELFFEEKRSVWTTRVLPHVVRQTRTARLWLCALYRTVPCDSGAGSR